MKTKYSGRIILISIYLIISCNSVNNKQKYLAPLNKPDTNYKLKQERIYYLFPSPNELISIISKTDITFQDTLPHSASKGENYSTPMAIQLNTGMYIADMAYCKLFNQEYKANIYYEILEYLSRYLYLSQQLKTELKETIQKQQNSIEQIEIESNKIFYDLIDDLESSGQKKSIALISSGAYIESLYLSLNSVNPDIHNNIIRDRLGEQRFGFKNLVSYLRNLDYDSELAYIINRLTKIETLYDNMKYYEEELKTERTTDSTIRIKGGKTYYLDRHTFEQLLNEVNTIRSDFIQMN